MRYDSYSRFLKSQLYKDCIVNEMEGKPLLHGKSEKKAKKSPNSPGDYIFRKIYICENS